MKFKLSQTGAFEAEFEYGKIEISSNTELGFRPLQLLVSSLAGCSGGLLKKVLEKKRITFDSIEIETDIERNEKEANKVTKIALHFIVYGINLNLTQVQKSLDLAVKNCAMIHSVNSAIEVVETIEVREQ
ncbi:osmotically inducible protein C [Compostibacillus humi]|uniref:Osmotically inducible protein C n=1 Tax=Compostibacillus humi TaxID=1245525 RepID=A0A8J2XHP1_9BACI|nr:OsmC family protein [Compostibacillus humi]GFZ90076.1 osmotically inducible protein C [Compostibacillus humi]